MLHFKICPFLFILVYWFLRCQCSLLPSPAWPHPVYLFHGPTVPGFYAVLFCTASDFTFTTRHIHSWASFPLWPSHFILSGAISNCPLFLPCSILNTFQPEVLIFRCHIFLTFHTVHGVLMARDTKPLSWSGLSFPPPVDHILLELFMMTYSA